ncbi:MAG TPA: c-type cytochrome [Candidatus Binataceae bacterium]|nr:c-type cytochrome [Candidatus Binataceae bacterium]
MSKRRFRILIILIAAAAASVSPIGVHALFAQDGTDLIARGRYLVNNVAMCGECHSPKIKNQPDPNHWLQGAQLHFHPGKPVPWFALYAPSIAGLPAGWSQAQVARFLETGATPGGVPPRAPMPAYRMDRADAEAVAAYLHSLRQ